MNIIALYILTIFIWGTTWFAIKLQIGHAPDEISILYRAFLAAICLLILCKIKGLSLRFKTKDHLFLCLLGFSMFSIHYLSVYYATNYIVSGVIAVVFSGVSFLGIVNNFIFFRIKPSLNIVLGTLIGISGLCVFFWHEVAQLSLRSETLYGLSLACIGTVIFSLGSSISKRNNQAGLPIIPSITVGTIYGTLIMIVYTILQSTPLVFPISFEYWTSLLYLVILGSVIAFLCYLKLIKEIGPELAGYTTVLFPIVALIISSMLEGYEWSLPDLIGLLLVISGNILVMQKKACITHFLKPHKML